jgi:glycogen operon protein
MPKIDVSSLKVTTGRPYPMGPMVDENGVRFTIFSRHATKVWVALFENIEDDTPVCEFGFDPECHRTGDVWSIFVHGLGEGVYFKYRMDGPFEPKKGHRFSPNSYLLDPYSKACVGDIHDGNMKCVTVRDKMDWSDDKRPNIPMHETVIYEAHVRGITAHPSAGAEYGGTYRSLIEKIPHLKELGITAVELLPVQEFGETYLGRCSLVTGKELTNYWGYSNIGFFAPAGRYACSAVLLEHLDEFREMVRALHAAGIEVILDVVFNHTSEGDERGPTLCFRGIDNAIYYLLGEDGHYFNYSGCGNTVNCNHPLVRDFILDCLRYWVAVMHIDGFRFDLASILGRDASGEVLEDAPLIERIAEDPVLRGTKLIAEAWDAGGAYQVGSFGKERWAEWNGRYRDDVRRYWRGDPGMRGIFAAKLAGSADVYQGAGRSPMHSINFITCHDGFTLRDLVSYNQKHNEANGEGNRDGTDANYSYNFGVEGDTDSPEVNAIRRRMHKNYLATLFLSLGVPMMLGGDEFGRTQRGNNNAYCQDNAISWFDWSLLNEYGDIYRFCREMISFRKANPALKRGHFFTGQPVEGSGEHPDLYWFEARGDSPTWSSPELPIGCRIDGAVNEGTPLCLIFNPTDEETAFYIPEGRWLVRIDTAQPSPRDIVCKDDAELFQGEVYGLAGRSLVVLSGE